MHHADGVRAPDPDARLPDDAERELRPERAEAADEVLEVVAGEQLHHDVRAVHGIDPGVEDARHVLRLEVAGDARLSLEPRERSAGVAAGVGVRLGFEDGHHLHGDAAVGA